MKTLIIVGTHGCAAGELIKTASMLIGEQEALEFITFVPGENADNLVEKYNNILTHHADRTGTLFLVDTWGGSPFNAASQVASHSADMDVVAGINVPMLVEVLMARDDGLALEDLVTVALDTGREGIRSLKGLSATETDRTHDSKRPVAEKVFSSEGHMTIALARIDDRLIHGQVATRWTKESRVNRIIVINDEVSKDKIRKTLLTQVAPPGVSAHVVDIDKAVRVYNNPAYNSDRVMFLFTNPTDVCRLIRNGVNIKEVNIGGMVFRQGKKQVTNALSIDKDDVDAFEWLNQNGVILEVRKVPSDPTVAMMDLIK